MAKKNSKSKTNNKQKQGSRKQNTQRSVVAHAPTSLSVRRTTPASGSRQEALLMEVKSGFNTMVIHPANIWWLKGVAPSYQYWNLANAQIWYEPRVSTSTNGMFVMCHQKDIADPIPQNVGQMSSVSGATRAAVWDKQQLRVSQQKRKIYCSLSNFLSMDSEDKTERSYGRITTYADMDPGYDVNTIIGRLYISYTPVLTDPTDPSVNG